MKQKDTQSPTHLQEKRPLKRAAQIVFTILLQAILFYIISHVYSGLTIDSFGKAISLSIVVGVLNALLWPALSALLLPITVFTFGLASLFLNGFILYIGTKLVSGVSIDLWWPVIWVSILLTVFNTIVASLFSIDDDPTYYRNVLKKKMSKGKTIKRFPGFIFLEIDGLSYPVLKKALDGGFMPTFKKWIDLGLFKFAEWETDLSCQTGASQTGILHGNNKDIPAFRWVDKKQGGRIVTSSSMSDTPEIEKKASNGKGLLAVRGASRNNMYSGDAEDCVMTLSRLHDTSKIYNPIYYGYFSAPYNFSRSIVLVVWEVILEYRSRIRQRIKNIQPRIGREKRGGVFPLVRAVTVVLLQDLTAFSVIGDIFGGEKDAVYATFVGYDEVAHHSGTEDIDALQTLTKVDRQFRRIARAIEEAPRDYHLVILSDHGQSLGATFLQRYGYTLEDLVTRLLKGKKKVHVTAQTETDEGWGHLNMVLSDAVQGEDTISSKAMRKLLKKKMYGDSVVLGSYKEYEKNATIKKPADKDEIVVLASGNLGLIYSNNWKGRVYLEDFEITYPNLVMGLAQHDGVSFVMVRSKKYGPVIIGKEGIVRLKTGKIEGKNPLANFPPNTSLHLLRTDSFTNAPDILVNSVYDAKTDQVAAFEQLVGSHGGIGGNQSRPFVMYPSDLSYPKTKVVGAEQLHKVLKGWIVGSHESMKAQDH